jgi:hypothetical protein
MNEILNPGKYFLGDPSNVLHNKILNGIWGDLYDYRNGKYNINSYDFVVHNTHKGDGDFLDTKNRIYKVSTGVLSLIAIELIEDITLCKNNGYIFTFVNKINFIYDAGIFFIKSGKKIITIDTQNKNDYDSDLDEHCENEDGEPIGKTLCNDSDNDSIYAENTLLFDSNDSEEEEEKIPSENLTKKNFCFFKPSHI